jgi:hypothetical protein
MPRRAGRPGIVGLAARTAVVAGTAGAVRNKQADKQAQKQADAQAQVAPAPAAPAAAPENDIISQLEKLADLKAQGLLNDVEYSTAKARILG